MLESIKREERLIIADKYKVLEYDINVQLMHLFRDRPVLMYDGIFLSIWLSYEEDVMMMIRFLVVNGRKFQYSYGADNHTCTPADLENEDAPITCEACKLEV